MSKRERDDTVTADDEDSSVQEKRARESEEVAPASDAPAAAAETAANAAAAPAAPANAEEAAPCASASDVASSNAPSATPVAAGGYAYAAAPAFDPAPALPAPSADVTTVGVSDEELTQLLQARADAKQRRDFAAADSIRGTLEQRGIKINDARLPGMVGTWTAADGRRCAQQRRA